MSSIALAVWIINCTDVGLLAAIWRAIWPASSSSRSPGTQASTTPRR
jgi:hypothetical protein